MIKELFSNPVFITIIISSLGVQLIKIAIFFLRSGKVHALDIIATGGMPSSHSSLMTGLMTIIFLTEGPTTIFFVTLALTMVIIVDALGVRRTAGEEGKLLHLILKQAKLKIREPHYSLGHTPEQVAVGAVLGVVVAVAVFWAL
ncbi:divergent PAP2 family protein [Candidatus Woesearchaeota archaeon]|nr:divergent PAP2 family protein [Candidatus Woesearchaeota archaeon]